MRIAVIADSHLSARAPECLGNWDVAAAVVTRLGAELTIHLGDISLDGQNRPEELDFAADAVRRWPTPMLCIPGNHDMGDGSGEAPLDRERLARCRRAFGPDRWAVRADRWELIGLNAQLLGTGTSEEDEQWQWLAAHLEQSIEPQHRMLLLHRPLVRPNVGPNDSERGRRGRYVVEAGCRRLLEDRLRDSLRFVMSGHTHQHLDRQVANVRHIWMPSTAFVLPDTMQARVGEKFVGIGLLDVTGGSARIDVLMPDGMTRHRLPELAVFAELEHEHGPAQALQGSAST
jgi:3',5'-cyclic AMP phosphodiesterase CpdA